MSQEPYAGAKRFLRIVDNGSSHCGKKAADRLAAAFPNTVMVHTPVQVDSETLGAAYTLSGWGRMGVVTRSDHRSRCRA
ncbi:hypothetical protein AB0D11_39730 [Streptomyces monashensis]|uniref:hypothetical protein n=1 Tax=Streptomyces monashensis TaxID=1678012 RepID=UPI0033FE73F6